METPKKVGRRRTVELPPDTVVPTATEAERGIASIALNHPEVFLHHISEKNFKVGDIFDPLSHRVCEIILQQQSRNASSEIRVVFEKVRETLPATEFHQLSDLYTLMPIAGAIGDLVDIVKNTAKRRTLQHVAYETLLSIGDSTRQTPELLSDVVMKVEGLSRELAPPKVMDTKALLINALNRYETGDDESMRIKTGYSAIDNICPIRYGDFVVIGGETKSGKTMLALNIIANLINETN
jgi:replicative DNA helicase